MNPHQTVLLNETLDLLAPEAGMTVVDVTCGGGGHTEQLALAVGESGRVFAVDQDPAALAIAKKRLSNFNQIRFIHANFRSLEGVLADLGINRVNGILADLGVSSMQLTDPARGFSFASEGELDMRMGGEGPTAAELLGSLSEDELGRIFRDYGEEHGWRKAARAVIRHRNNGGRFTGPELQRIVHGALQASRSGRVDSATRVFQALRIAVNDELGALEAMLNAGMSALGAGGRIAVISFHSLEDRIVKNAFRDAATGCICPKDLPRCVCGRKPRFQVLTRKPVVASETEQAENPRSRSAKLRAAEKLVDD